VHNEGLYDLYSPLNIIQVIKSSSVRWIRACTMNGGDETCIQGFGGGNLRVRDHVGDLGIDRRIILKWNFQMWDEGMGSVGLVLDGDRWWAVENTVMNL